MNNTELFLDKYKQLEDAAANRFGEECSSQIARLERMPQFESVSAGLRYCREVRNLLQHNPKIDGQYAVTPSDNMLRLLENVIQRVVNPPRACDAALKIQNIYHRGLEATVLRTMRDMVKRDLSKVPITQQGRVIGVFSQETLFARALSTGLPPLDENTRLHELRDFLTIDRKYYRFAPYQAPLDEIESLFDEAYARHIRIRNVFLTESGKESEPLLGLITPWELIDKL